MQPVDRRDVAKDIASNPAEVATELQSGGGHSGGDERAKESEHQNDARVGEEETSLERVASLEDDWREQHVEEYVRIKVPPSLRVMSLHVSVVGRDEHSTEARACEDSHTGLWQQREAGLDDHVAAEQADDEDCDKAERLAADAITITA